MKRYDKEFKREAIRLALSDGKSIAQTVRDLGIKESLLYSWINQAKKSDVNIPSEEFKNACLK